MPKSSLYVPANADIPQAPGCLAYNTVMKPDAQLSPDAIANLATELALAEAIKANMQKLLAELESAATKKPVQKTGQWRHHPTEWAKDNKLD